MDTPWRVPSELPDLRRIGLVAIDTETKDDGLAADRGSGWATRQGHICGISVAYRVEANIQTLYSDPTSRQRELRTRAGLRLAQGSRRVRSALRHAEWSV